LYGYDKETNPLLAQYKADGNLIVYDNVVSFNDHTHEVMKSIFHYRQETMTSAITLYSLLVSERQAIIQHFTTTNTLLVMG